MEIPTKKAQIPSSPGGVCLLQRKLQGEEKMGDFILISPDLWFLLSSLNIGRFSLYQVKVGSAPSRHKKHFGAISHRNAHMPEGTET